jgi:hypothetical protein
MRCDVEKVAEKDLNLEKKLGRETAPAPEDRYASYRYIWAQRRISL